MKNLNYVKRCIIAFAFGCAILGLQVDLKKDFDGNITLDGLKSREVRAANSEGHLIAYSCTNSSGVITGYGNSCAMTSTLWCSPNDCK